MPNTRFFFLNSFASDSFRKIIIIAEFKRVSAAAPNAGPPNPYPPKIAESDGPKTKPSPRAAPISPMPFVLSDFSVMSDI